MHTSVSNTCSCGCRVCVSRCFVHYLHGGCESCQHHFDDALRRIHDSGKRTAARAETALRSARARSDHVAVAGLCFRDGASFDLVCPANVWEVVLTTAERQRLGTVRPNPTYPDLTNYRSGLGQRIAQRTLSILDLGLCRGRAFLGEQGFGLRQSQRLNRTVVRALSIFQFGLRCRQGVGRR
jgi:hypothetical protein